MLPRSFSTPIVRRHFLSDTQTHCNHCCNHHPPPALDHCTTRLSSVHGGRPRLSLSSLSCSSSLNSPSSSGSANFCRKTNRVSNKSFRRARSVGNLKGLTPISLDLDIHEESMLRTEPSFCIYTTEDGCDRENEKEGMEKFMTGNVCLGSSVRIGESSNELGSSEFSFGRQSIGLIEEEDEDKDKDEEVLSELQDLGIGAKVEPASPRMHLAMGLGIGGYSIGSSGGGVLAPACFHEGGNVEEYYERMTKGDLHGAEDYLFRATLADPKDGEISMLYAKLVWELHHDQHRALNYFEQAARASPEDSRILSAYACFLWEIEVDKEEDCAHNGHTQVEEDKDLVEVQNSAFEEEKVPVCSPLHLTAPLGIDIASAGGIDSFDCIDADSGKGCNMEEHYKRVVEDNPCNPLFLGNYAQFLYQSKGDLQGAEEYYSRAILADPADGEIISQYAKLVWELHHDKDKALSCFERAVQATPEDSHVLAAYASFLWETEED